MSTHDKVVRIDARALPPEGGNRPNFRWVKVHNKDELEAFYAGRLYDLKAAAKHLGYALAHHGSLRRDLDLLAVPWAEDHSTRDALARALQDAACGLWQAKYQWEEKPCGRCAASFPVCWTERSENFPVETNLGHIDLSVMPAHAPASAGGATDIQQGEFRHAYDHDLSKAFAPNSASGSPERALVDMTSDRDRLVQAVHNLQAQLADAKAAAKEWHETAIERAALVRAVRDECAKFNFPDEDRPELHAALVAYDAKAEGAAK